LQKVEKKLSRKPEEQLDAEFLKSDYNDLLLEFSHDSPKKTTSKAVIRAVDSVNSNRNSGEEIIDYFL
jgi:hypothetical protein